MKKEAWVGWVVKRTLILMSPSLLISYDETRVEVRERETERERLN